MGDEASVVSTLMTLNAVPPEPLSMLMFSVFRVSAGPGL